MPLSRLLVALYRLETRPSTGSTVAWGATTSGDVRFNGRTLEFRRGYYQAGSGLTDLLGGRMVLGPDQWCRIQGGTLRGGGTIQGPRAFSAGSLEVGDNPGALTLRVTGQYRQQAGAGLHVLARPGDLWGLLDIGGDAELAGTLALDMLMGYAPAVGFTRTVLTTAGTRT